MNGAKPKLTAIWCGQRRLIHHHTVDSGLHIWAGRIDRDVKHLGSLDVVLLKVRNLQ